MPMSEMEAKFHVIFANRPQRRGQYDPNTLLVDETYQRDFRPYHVNRIARWNPHAADPVHVALRANGER